MHACINIRRLDRAVFSRLVLWSGIAGLSLLAAGWIGPHTCPCQAAERWTSLDGSNTVEAEFVGLWGNNVVLELPGARRVSVSMDNLVAESRIQARRMGEDQERRREERRQQILADAKEAAAPAPTPLPKPTSPPAYQRLSSSGGLLSQLEWLDQQNRNGHGLIAAFDSLPPSYQSDLERLLHLSLEKLDIQGMNQVLGSVHSIGDLVVTRQRWLFSHPRLDSIDASARDTLKSVLLSIGGLIRDGIDPAQLKLEDLATTPLRTWIVNLDERLAPHIAAMNDQFEALGIESTAYEVKVEKDGKATVEMTNGQAKQSVNFVAVDGLWMPADADAEKWAEAMKKWEDALSTTQDGALLAGGAAQMVPLLLDPILEPAVKAQSAREFHAAMDGWLAMAAPLIAQASRFGIGGNRSRGGDPYGYGSGYDDMDMQDYYEEDVGMDDTQ